MKILLFTTALLLSNCSTVPDDAPEEFKTAEKSIDEMNRNDADDYLPKTAEKAENTLHSAVEALRVSRKGNDSTSTQLEAIEIANQANEIAIGTTRLSEKIRTWDKSIDSFQMALAMLDETENPTTDVVVIEPEDSMANLRGSEFVSTLAFFDTNQATDPAVNTQEFEALVKILQKDTKFQVVLTGYADPRGDVKYNKNLGLERAKSVADELKDRGIQGKQLVLQSAGESDNFSVDEERAKLQLARKVQAKLILM